MDSAGLPNPVSPVNSLLLYGWVPPLQPTRLNCHNYSSPTCGQCVFVVGLMLSQLRFLKLAPKHVAGPA